MPNYKYQLEGYANGHHRYECPSCHDKRSFTRYVDTETGEYVDESCGKCNHENSCQYHYPPRDYFRDHPDETRKKPWDPFLKTSRKWLLGCGRTYTTPQIPMEEPVQTEFFDFKMVEESCQRTCLFRKWIEGLGLDPELTQRVLSEYYVGATVYSVSIGTEYYGAAAVFWQIDEQMRVHDAKMIPYKPDGHRLGDKVDWMRAYCERTKFGPHISQTDKVLFGQHLLPRYPDKPVCIVESEKSAIICAILFPQYLWMATGGCGNLQPAKLRPLMDRTVLVFPDSGEHEKWCMQMKESGHTHYTVVDEFEQYEPNNDIADVILGEAKLKSNHNSETI